MHFSAFFCKYWYLLYHSCLQKYMVLDNNLESGIRGGCPNLDLKCNHENNSVETKLGLNKVSKGAFDANLFK
jgi:hypothetical protein